MVVAVYATPVGTGVRTGALTGLVATLGSARPVGRTEATGKVDAGKQVTAFRARTL